MIMSGAAWWDTQQHPKARNGQAWMTFSQSRFESGHRSLLEATMSEFADRLKRVGSGESSEWSTWQDLCADTAHEIERLEKRIAELERELADFRRGYTYPNMCRKGHPEVGSEYGEDEKCPVCQANERIEVLEKECWVERARADQPEDPSVIKITHDQIKAAVEYANDESVALQGKAGCAWDVLDYLNIKRCEGCGGRGGSGGYSSTYDFVTEEVVGSFESCSTCNGDGWVIANGQSPSSRQSEIDAGGEDEFNG